MAGRGPTPSPNARRANKQPTVALTGVNVDVPELESAEEYRPETLRWWRTWVTSPQAESFLPTDIERLRMLAPLVDRYWDAPNAAALSELRLNEERLGATIRDRQSLRMFFKTPEAEDERRSNPAYREDARERYMHAYGPDAYGPDSNVSRLRQAFGEE